MPIAKYYKGSGKKVMKNMQKEYGKKKGKLIRVQKADEVNEVARLRSQLRQAKEALADAHMELVLEKAFLAEACEQLDQTVEGFKKKQGGRRRTGRLGRTGN